MRLLDDPLLESVPVIDGYKLLEPCVLYAPIGRGGMGAVYRGRHLNLQLDVAVKCLMASLAAEDPDFVSRFQREARVAAAVSDANLIRTYDVGKRHGVHYLVMEYVEGENLRDRVTRKGPLPLDEALTIAIAASKGLAAAHASGVIHRDVKPANILVSRLGQVKVADLGLAKAADAVDSLATKTHVVLGTPQYMPPEQFQSAKDVGPPGDVYALAACLWFMIEGRDAVEGGALSEVMCRVVIDGFPDVSSATHDIPPPVAEVIERATRKEPVLRYANADALGEALQGAARALGLKASLADDEAGAAQAVQSMVSPPPVETLTRIQAAVESGSVPPGVETPTVRSDDTAPIPVTPSAAEAPARARRRSLAALGRWPAATRRPVGLALAALGALAFAFALIVPAGGAADAGPRGAARNAPSSMVPARDVQFVLAVHDLREGWTGVQAIARNVQDLGDPERRDEIGEMMAEVTDEFFGIGVPRFDDLEVAGIDTGAGLAFASYWNGVAFTAFRTADADAFRRELERRWKVSGYRFESDTRQGMQVVTQRSERGDWVRRSLVIDGDLVYRCADSDVERMVAWLIEASDSTLDADVSFTSATSRLVEDRDVTMWFDLPSHRLDDDPELRDLISGFGGFAASVRHEDGVYDVEMLLEVDASSKLADMVGNERESLLGYFDVANTMAAVEFRLDRAAVMAWIDSIDHFSNEMREADLETREALGQGFRREILDRVDGRVAWIVGTPAAGRITAFPGGEAQVVNGRSRFPLHLSREFQRYVDAASRPLSLALPATTLVIGVEGEPEELIRALENLLSAVARDEDGVRFSATGDPGARRVEVEIPDQGLTYDLDLTAGDGFVVIGARDAATPVSARPFGRRTFGRAPGSIARAWIDVPAIGEWLLPAAAHGGADAFFRRLASSGPLVVELGTSDDGAAVATARLGPAFPFVTDRHPLWWWISGLLVLGGSALFVSGRARGPR